MKVPTTFELDSIKDQLSMLAALSSHIDFDTIEEKNLDPDYERLLKKMNNMSNNLTKKFQDLKKVLET